MSTKIYIIILISIFQLSFPIALSNIKVNGGNYGNIFKFYISGTTTESITRTINIPMKILIEEEEKEAQCSIDNTESGSLALYTCIYSENIESNLYLKNEQDYISGINVNMLIKPIDLSIRYIEVFNLEFIDQVWQYNLKGEINGETQINSGSLVYMNIKVNNTNKIAGCIFSSNNENQVLFNCKINNNNQKLSDKIMIPNSQTTGSISFNPVLENDMNIIIYKEIPFIESKKLNFNGDKNKWEFLIIIPNQLIPVSTKSIVDIFYNQELSSATCFSNDNSILECEVDNTEQIETDLVTIHYIKSQYSTIKWSNLTKVYEIPIEKELTYLNSVNLAYTSTKLWSFIIKFSEDNIFPEQALVTIDIKINDNSSIVKCYYVNSNLKCKTENIEEEETLSLKISYEKKDGSIKWKNIRTKDIPITISSQITYENSYDLQFINNAWTFLLKATTTNDKISKFPFSIRIGYVIEEEKNEGIAYCYPLEDITNIFNCEVEYENQNNNDLILLTSSTESVSVIWNTEFEEKNIILLTSLNFIKAFDLMYLNEKWIFNIKIENSIPNGSKVKVDILFNEIREDTATCFFNSNTQILSCTRDSTTQSPTESLKLKFEKKSGSIVWDNIDISVISEKDMPLTVNKNILKAYGLYFDDIWNFYLDLENIGIIPNNSYFYLDVIKNDEETIAICELANRTQTATVTILFCHLDNNTQQSRTDEIRINTEKKEGSINFSYELTNTNNTISEANSDPTEFYLLDAYDMEFINNEWIFTIIGKAGRDIYKGEVFKIEVKYILLERQYDTRAKCWTKGGSQNDKIKFLCNVDYEGQTENGLIQIKYFQTEESTLIWNGGIDDNYQITLRGLSLTLVKAYDLALELTWKFKISVENGILPPGAQVVIDVIITQNSDINSESLLCTSLNSSLIICDTYTSSEDTLIEISEEPLLDSSIIWNENKQNDYLIYLNIKFEFNMVYNLYFDITINIWIFIIKKSVVIIPIGSKLSVDILYNDLPSLATCYYKEDNDEIKCSVDKGEQNKLDLVQLNHIKTTGSSITFINLLVDEKISLISDLTFDKAENLRKGADDFWIFEIFIKEENLLNVPNYSKFVIDIYCKIDSIQTNSVAICYLENLKLSCKTEFKTYELVTIKLTKTSNSLSTVTWDNKDSFDNDNIPMVISTSLNYINITKINYIENNYYFYINLNNYVPQEGEVIIDIEINNETMSTSCMAETITKLKCHIKNNDYQNNTFIYVVPKNTHESTVTWINLERHVQINMIYLIFLGAYDKKDIDETHIGFKILTSGGILEDGTEIFVKINYIDANGNIISSSIIPCTSEKDFLICKAEKNNLAFDFNLYLTSTQSSSSDIYDGIIWSNGKNDNTKVYQNLQLDFDINSFDYNTDDGCYEFSFQDKSYTSGSTFFVTDVTIGGRNTYAYCNYKNDNFYCKTNKVEYNENDELLISPTQTYGGVQWKNPSTEKKINKYFFEISQIYDLNFVNDKWKFKIQSNSDKTYSEDKIFVLDILISGNIGKANCKINQGLIECEVVSEGQTANSLIQLNDNINGDIKFSNLVNMYIPLNIILIFTKIYDYSYSYISNKWNFEIKATIEEEGRIIPDNSIFTVDIKNDNTNDIAVCTKKERTENVIILSCHTEKEVSQNAKITLNNDKSNYSSITWKEGTLIDDLEIFISANLYVDSVDNLKYDTNSQKWNFEMNLDSYYSFNYPLNSQVKIDINYGGNNATATCTYTSTSERKFLCIPDVESQNQNDIFEISKTKKDGTITFLNSEEKLIILSTAKLKFKMAYDLLFLNSGKCNFKIKVLESNISNQRSIIVDFKEDYNYRTAICTMNNLVLYCTSLQTISSNNPIYLINNGLNTYVEWSNLSNNKPIYVTLNIILLNVFGCFMENNWKFNIKYESEGESLYYYNNHALLDILVNEVESTALCKISYNNVLKCESSQNKNDKIKIVGNTEPISGTVYFTEELTDTQKEFEPASINLNLDEIYNKNFYNNKLSFTIGGLLTENEKNFAASFTEIELLIDKKNGETTKTRASCEINYNDYNLYVSLKCSTDIKVNSNEDVKINTESNGYSKYVKFILEDNQDLYINIYNDEDDDDNNYNNNNNNNNNNNDDEYYNNHNNNNNERDYDDEERDLHSDKINTNTTDTNNKSNNTKTIVSVIIGVTVGIGAMTAGIILWVMLRKGTNIPITQNNQVNLNRNDNVLNNNNYEVYRRNDNKKGTNKSSRSLISNDKFMKNKGINKKKRSKSKNN